MPIVAGQQILAADVIAIGFKSGMIIIWAGTIANIPAGFVICDGNNSTPNLLTRFIQGVATAATNPGTTGGATAKTLTRGGATANQLSIGAVGSVGGAMYAFSGAGVDTIYPNFDGISDIRPLYYDVAFIMKT